MSLNGYNDSLLEQEKIAKSEYGRSFLAWKIKDQLSGTVKGIGTLLFSTELLRSNKVSRNCHPSELTIASHVVTI
jgi:hypothetical protein